MKDLIAAGKAKHWGLSEVAPDTLRKAHAELPVSAYQTQYSFGITTMENTLTKLVKQQERTRRLLMTMFFTGIVPLLAFLTALVLKVWVLT